MDLVTAPWRKSSYSGPETNCVEVSWRKSASSGPETACVEVAFGSGRIGVRDSKNPAGGALVLPEPAWSAMKAAFIAPTAPR